MEYIIEGDKVGFTELKSDYVELYKQWINDLEVSQFLSTFDSIVTEEAEQNWFQDQIENGGTAFTIHYLPEDRPIGNCGLHKLDRAAGHAEMGIMLGEKEYWDRGLGTEAVKFITDFGFTALNLHVIYLALKSYNKRARRVYEKIGYRESGRKRDFYELDGEYFDKIIMDVLREEFYRTNKHLIREEYLTDLN